MVIKMPSKKIKTLLAMVVPKDTKPMCESPMDAEGRSLRCFGIPCSTCLLDPDFGSNSKTEVIKLLSGDLKNE